MDAPPLTRRGLRTDTPTDRDPREAAGLAESIGG